MAGTAPTKTAFLTLDELTADPELARRLPPDLAWRYHALPLAEDNGRVTVAMADPDDAEAREAVVAALGPEPCIIKGSAAGIDARLAEIWGGAVPHRLAIKVCAFPGPLSDELWDYGRALAALLGGRAESVTNPGEVTSLAEKQGRADCDLIVVGKGSDTMIRSLLGRSMAGKTLLLQQKDIALAVLAVQELRWPLARILLVLCGDIADGAAMDWALRLACPSRAAVTLLAVIPPAPATNSRPPASEQSLRSLLTSGTALGCQMRQVARRLVESKVDGTLRLRQGAPDQQICREIAVGDHDLIILTARSCWWWMQQLKGDPISSLLSWVNRPVLFVEPTFE